MHFGVREVGLVDAGGPPVAVECTKASVPILVKSTCKHAYATEVVNKYQVCGSFLLGLL